LWEPIYTWGIREGFSEEMELRWVLKDAPEFIKEEGAKTFSEVRITCTKKGTGV
jgi:hypothetical protein